MQKTWTFVLDRWDAYQRAAGYSAKTIEGRRAVLEKLAELIGKPPQLVQHEDLIDFLNRPHARTGGPLSPGTKQTERSYLSCWGD